MADGTKRAGGTVNWERFFFCLGRFNAVAIALIVIGSAILMLLSGYWPYSDDSRTEGRPYGSEHNKISRLIGQGIDTADGQLVAYYEEGDDNERDDLGGVTLVNPKSGESVELAVSPQDSLIMFELIVDHGGEEPKVVGYVASVASSSQYPQGRADLIVGALPAMTRTVVAEDVRYVDLPIVRGNNTVGMIVWPTEDDAKVIGVDLITGRIIDSAKIALPAPRSNTLSHGPGVADDPGLRRDPGYGRAPVRVFEH